MEHYGGKHEQYEQILNLSGFGGLCYQLFVCEDVLASS